MQRVREGGLHEKTATRNPSLDGNVNYATSSLLIDVCIIDYNTVSFGDARFHGRRALLPAAEHVAIDNLIFRNCRMRTGEMT